MLASISAMVIALVKSLAQPDFAFKQRSDDPIRLAVEHAILGLSCGYSPLVPSDVAKALESSLQMEVLHVEYPVTPSRMMAVISHRILDGHFHQVDEGMLEC